MDILNAREARSNHIHSLIKEYPHKTVAILKLNVVGENKNPSHMKFICLLFDNLMKTEFKHKLIDSKKTESLDGDYIYYIIDEQGALVKERTINIEDHQSFGRLVDIDIYHNKPISRTDLECEMRTCLICDNYAHICARNQTHTKEELDNKVNDIIQTNLTELIFNEVMNSLYQELDMYPKFGLVSYRDSGSHQDMDYELFRKSTLAIKPYIKQFIEYGFDNNNPRYLQKLGLHAENDMFQVTNGINTQKGLIFALGIFLPSLVKTIINNQGIQYMQEEIKSLSKQIIGNYYETLNQKEILSHGDNIYLKTGMKGIRGEALNGFNLIFDIDSFESISTINRPYEYLIHLMSKLDDTTIIHRKGLNTLKNVQSEMKDYIELGGFTKSTLIYKKLSDKYKERNISPGGSSDLLVLKLIYENLKYLLCPKCIN